MRLTSAVVLMLVILLAATWCVAQPAKAPHRVPAAAPAPVAAPAAPAASDAGEDTSSPWHDMVHYFGLVNAGLAILTFLGGVTLLLGFEVRGKQWKDPVRVKIRYVHMTAGVLAITAGLTHYIGRCVQGGQAWWGPIPPTWAFLGFVLLLITGILRFKTPWKGWQWLHRVGFVVALYYLKVHLLYQLHRHLDHKI